MLEFSEDDLPEAPDPLPGKCPQCGDLLVVCRDLEAGRAYAIGHTCGHIPYKSWPIYSSSIELDESIEKLRESNKKIIWNE